MENTEDVFFIWDLKDAKIFSDFDAFKNVTWPDWCLSSLVNARYINQKFSPMTEDEEKKYFYLESCKLTTF